MNHSAPGLLAVSIFSLALAACVVVLGAWVRLSHAGLGCPDWPGCYGKLWVTADGPEEPALSADPTARPFNAAKAVKEMTHRYAAGLLGLALLGLAVATWRRRHPQRFTAAALLGLVVAQALVGMWTVTELLKPLIVTVHLLGGMLILALLFWLTLRQLPLGAADPARFTALARLLQAALAVLVAQVFLGGWTGANYAALACLEFPACRGGAWLPPADFREAFVLWREGRLDYEGGVLDQAARTAIHLAHRLGAVVAAVILLVAACRAWAARAPALRLGAAALACALAAQLSLGVANVLLRLPLPVAVAHNAGAALLLLLLLTLYAYTQGKPGRGAM